jgi:hypothetical protein
MFKLCLMVCFNMYCWRALKWVVFFSNFIVEPANRYNTALVCHKWGFLACHPRLWLRVERPIRDVMELGVYPNLEATISAARSLSSLYVLFSLWIRDVMADLHVPYWRPSDTCGSHVACNIQINKPICIVSFAFHVPQSWRCQQGHDLANASCT